MEDDKNHYNPKKKDKWITIYLTEKEKNDWVNYAKERGLSISKFVRNLISEKVYGSQNAQEQNDKIHNLLNQEIDSIKAEIKEQFELQKREIDSLISNEGANIKNSVKIESRILLMLSDTKEGLSLKKLKAYLDLDSAALYPVLRNLESNKKIKLDPNSRLWVIEK